MGLGLPEILVILVLVLILFGAGKLPKVMGDLGKGVQSFRDGMAENGTKTPKNGMLTVNQQHDSGMTTGAKRAAAKPKPGKAVAASARGKSAAKSRKA